MATQNTLKISAYGLPQIVLRGLPLVLILISLIMDKVSR